MKRLFNLFCITASIFLFANAVLSAEVHQKKIRVGFFHFDGYHMRGDQKKNGEYNRSGYGYELLQMLLPYTNWEYEYIGYEKGWSAMIPMLEKGEIDLLTSAVKVPEKEKNCDFSSHSIGFSSVIMTVKAGCTQYLPQDYSNWNGMKVGVLSNNSKNKVFADFAKSKNFTYKEIPYTQTELMCSALQKGEIDAVVTGSLRRLHNEWLYEELDIRPFYIIVKKGNTALLKEIDNALVKLEIDYPGFADRLRIKYYNHSAAGGNEIAFSLDERKYQSACETDKRKFKVLINPDRFPFSYYENGQFKGIMRTLLDTVATRSGLDLEPVFCKGRKEYYEKIRNRECELIFDMQYDFSRAEQRGYILTDPYLSATISRISRKSFNGKMQTCAVVADSNMSEIVQTHLSKSCRINTYPTMEAVIEAVKKGQENTGFIFTRTAENAILNDKSGILTLDPSGYTVHFALGVKKELDRSLIGILSKTVRSLTEEEIQQALMTDNFRFLHKPTFRELVMENPLIVSLSLIGLILILGSALIIVRIYHRQAEKAAADLAKNSRMWKLLINSLPIHIFAKTGNKEQRFIFNNRARAEFFGIDPSEMDGKTDYDLLSRDQAEQIREITQKLCDAGQGQDENFLNVTAGDGSVHRLYSILVPFIDSDGTRLLLGCSVDQTELEETRKRAEENAEWFQKTLISIGDAVLATDTEGKITLLNPVAEQLLDVTLAECQGKAHTDFFHLVSYLDETEVPSPVNHCLATGRIISLSNHTDLISKAGKRYHIADSAAPIRGSNGTIFGAILVFRDVTKEYDLRDRLQHNAVQLNTALAQAQQASNAKGVFLSQMSHEIRTPLNAIIGYLNIALDSSENRDKILEYLSSIESGKLKITSEDFDFKHLLTGLVSMFYNQAESKKITFDLILQDLTEEWLVGDSLRLNQILLNLLSNAMKFTPAGGSVTLTVKQLGIVQGRVQIMLKITDTGCGISQEFMSRIFQPFEQQDASTARMFGGTGLGLSITKNLVTLMSGSIEIESQKNAGTTFTVYLSFGQSLKAQTNADIDFSKLRALVADDREEEREYIKMVLTKCKVKCDTVDSGEAAIRQLIRRMDSRHPYDLCLLDLRLSGMNGIETTREIRKSKCNTELPIILITAYDVSAFSEQAAEAGVNKIIQKPLFQSTFFDFLMTTYYHLDNKKNNLKVKEALKGLKVLLVEDNQMNMDISTQYLQRAGMKIVSAWNGKEAVELFEKSAPGTFQVILMDIQMPVMDGYEATKKIRASSHPEAKTIPVIAMTANAFNDDIVKALKAGMNDHISKPVFYDRLFESLSKFTLKKS